MHRLGLALTVAACAAAALPAQAAAHPHHDASALERYAAPATDGMIVGPDDASSFNATLPNGRRVTPAGLSTMVGELPLGSALSPDGRFLIVSDDDQATAKPGLATPYTTARGFDKVTAGFRITVVRTADMTITDHRSPPSNPPVNPPAEPGRLVPGLDPQTDKFAAAWLGVAVKDNGPGAAPTVYVSGGPNDIVSVWTLSPTGTLTAGTPRFIAIPAPSDRDQPNYGMAAPGGLTLSPDGSTLYVVNNNANSVIAVDTVTNTVVTGSQQPVGFFPYTGVIAPKAAKLFVSNWGVTDRAFTPAFLQSGLGAGAPLFALPATDPQRSSSVSVLDLTGGVARAISLARPIDGVDVVGGTHPSAMAVGTRHGRELIYVADANEDRVAVIDAATERTLRAIDLPDPVWHEHSRSFGLYPDALALSPDGRTLYVAEAGLNAVAVFDLTNPWYARYEGAIPTGWYPSSLQVSPDGGTLYVVNAKGFGAPLPANGSSPNVNLLFGSAERIDLATADLWAGARQVRANTYREASSYGARGLHAAEEHVRHVIFVLRENKTYDIYLGADATLNGRGADGAPALAQWDAVVPNTKRLAEQFAVGDQAYADSEESDAGHQYALAGTSTDFSQKTLASKANRQLINIKNEDPDDYPLRGYLFNAAARAHLSYRDYGDMLRLTGYDEGDNPNGCADDPANRVCTAGEATLGVTDPRDMSSPTVGLGGLYAETTPALKVLAGHIDPNYPGWNLHISDQRREREFERDFSLLMRAHRVPRFAFVWLPQDHTGTDGATLPPKAQVADNDAAVGRLVEFISHSSIWRDTAIFIAEDDAQGPPDHVSAHRTVAMVVSPWARRQTVVHTPVSTASITKTVDELLGLEPSSQGDELATDMRDWFTSRPDYTPFTALPYVEPPITPAGNAITELGAELDTSGPDTDSFRQARLDMLASQADELTGRRGSMPAADYERGQQELYETAVGLVRGGAPDDD